MSQEAIALAILTGAAFAAIGHWLWCWTPGKVAAVLFLVWIITTVAQQLLRIYSGLGGWDELISITELRLAQGAAAVLTAYLLERRCD